MDTITISGTPGSGKTTVARILHKKTGLKYIYSGLIFRELAQKHDMSLSDFGKYCEKNPKIDKELDERQVEILKKGNVILEGRLAGWMAYKNNIPAFKVMLDADVSTRVKRIIKREDGDFEEKKEEMIERENSEAIRYRKYYNIDLNDKSIYDIVINTSEKTPDSIVEEIQGKL